MFWWAFANRLPLLPTKSYTAYNCSHVSFVLYHEEQISSNSDFNTCWHDAVIHTRLKVQSYHLAAVFQNAPIHLG